MTYGHSETFLHIASVAGMQLVFCAGCMRQKEYVDPTVHTVLATAQSRHVTKHGGESQRHGNLKLSVAG